MIKPRVLRAIKAGRISGANDEQGWHVASAEPHRVYPESGAVFVERFGSRPVERPLYEFDGIDRRAELDAKSVNRLLHRHRHVTPAVNDPAHRFFDGCYHLLDRHVAVSLRHGPAACRLTSA